MWNNQPIVSATVQRHDIGIKQIKQITSLKCCLWLVRSLQLPCSNMVALYYKYMKTRWHPQNQKCITYHTATITGNTYKKCGEIWTCSFWDMRSDRQTNTQTNRQANWFTILCTPIGAWGRNNYDKSSYNHVLHLPISSYNWTAYTQCRGPDVTLTWLLMITGVCRRPASSSVVYNEAHMQCNSPEGMITRWASCVTSR